MKFRRQTIFFCFGILLLSFGSLEAQTKFPNVVIRGSEVRSLKSKETGRDYDLYIRVPGDLKSGRKYPVLYLLDGQWDFKLLDSIHGGLLYDKYIPEMVIVGITYSGDNPNYDALRAMDYTPTAESRLPGSGDAANFLAFLKKDVIPFVEKNYQGDSSKRVLMGSSLGGLFTLYAMFAEPDLFYGYVSASPAVSYGDNFSFKQEKLFAEKNKSLPVKLFISVGAVEGLTEPVKNFMQVVRNRSYAGLKMESRVIEDERHAGNKPEAFNRGLRFVFYDDRSKADGKK
jgi:predicted alpha/beta superfamily hydrolase